MADVATTILDERRELEQSLLANPDNPALHVKLARLEAQIWAQDAEAADLARLVQHLDQALEKLPADHHPQLVNFAKQVQQRGANIAPLIKNGQYPRLLALLTGRPLPRAKAPMAANGSPPPTAPVAEPAAESPPPEAQTPPPEAQAKPPRPQRIATPKPAPPRQFSPSGANHERKGLGFKEIDVGAADPAQLRQWLQRDQFVELASAYPLIDNFRTQRLVIDKFSEKNDPLGLVCLAHVLTHEHDDKTINYITKKILAFDPKMIVDQMTYDPADSKYKETVIGVLAASKSEGTVRPLQRALRDPNSRVRAKALKGLLPIIDPDEGWIKQLGKIICQDAEPHVRLTAVQGLRNIDTSRAFAELDAISKQCAFDSKMQAILDDMSQKFLTDRLVESRAKRREQKAKESKSSLVEKESMSAKDVGKLIVVVMVLAAACFFGYMQVKRTLDPLGDRSASLRELDEMMKSTEGYDKEARIRQEMAENLARSKRGEH